LGRSSKASSRLSTRTSRLATRISTSTTGKFPVQCILGLLQQRTSQTVARSLMWTNKFAMFVLQNCIFGLVLIRASEQFHRSSLKAAFQLLSRYSLSIFETTCTKNKCSGQKRNLVISYIKFQRLSTSFNRLNLWLTDYVTASLNAFSLQRQGFPFLSTKSECHVPPFPGTWTSTASVAAVVCSNGWKISSVSLWPFPAIGVVLFLHSMTIGGVI
jgi:hypothetical protein